MEPPTAEPVLIDWIADQGGRVVGMRYHDGELAGVMIDDAAVRVSVRPVGGGLTIFDLVGDVSFGSIGLTSNDIVVDVWAFRLDPTVEPAPAMWGAVCALHGGGLRDEDVAAAVERVGVEHSGRLLVTFACACTSEFSILADDMRVTKTGY